MFAITAKVKIAAGIAAGALTLGAAGAYAATANNTITIDPTKSVSLSNGQTTLKLVALNGATTNLTLPTSFTALVTCDDKANTTSTVTFGAGGGIGVASPPLTGLPIGTVCTVVEQNTGSFPVGTIVTYDPADAATDGVTIPDSEVGVTVQITNDFSGVEILPETVVTPPTPATPAAAVVAPATFTG